jgi:hypothetical protein
MTNLYGFEARLLRALTDLDASRPATLPARAGRPRRRRTRRCLTLVAAAAALICATTAAAAASGLLPFAPAGVMGIFAALDGSSGHRVEADQAVRIGVIDEHAAYAAPTADGGFCLYFAPNPRSGPTGTYCIPRGAGPDEVVFSLLPGTDGGLIFGRVGAGEAAAVAVTFPGGTGSVRTPVADAGFFVVKIPDPAMRSLMIETPPGGKVPPTKDGGPVLGLDLNRVTEISVTATDASGTPVGHGVTSPDWVR